jgi:hypothetical protein
LTSKHQTIQLEAVLAESASPDDGEALWDIFVHVGRSLERVLRRYKGLIVSKFAMRRDTSMVELLSLFTEGVPKQPPMWMPPREVCEEFKTLELDIQLEACATELFDCM